MLDHMKKVIVYTDGACSGNPGPGGWGAIMMYGGHIKEISGFEKETTNNRMEMTAAMDALKALKKSCEVELYSDSAYLINAFSRHWIYGWLKNGWKRGDNEEVKNTDLWKELLRLSRIHKIEWIKVKGHSDNKFNNRCDEMAREQIEANR